MLIKDLKESIVNKTINKDMIIFLISDNNFIAKQYIREISNIFNLDINNVDEVPKVVNDIFGTSIDVINVFETDLLEKIQPQELLYVITKKVSDEVKDNYNGYIVNVPKLEEWQIKDYAYSLAEGVPEEYLAQLCEVCKYDIYKIDNELKKLKVFDVEDRGKIFKQMLDDNMYSDLTKHNIFDLSNAIIRKDIPALIKLYKQIDNIDYEPIGLITTLYNNFKNIVNIQLSRNPTPQSCNLSEKQFWAIKKYSCGYYTSNQLTSILCFLTNIDKKIKTGEIFTDDRLTDYVISHIICM